MRYKKKQKPQNSQEQQRQNIRRMLGSDSWETIHKGLLKLAESQDAALRDKLTTGVTVTEHGRLFFDLDKSLLSIKRYFRGKAVLYAAAIRGVLSNVTSLVLDVRHSDDGSIDVYIRKHLSMLQKLTCKIVVDTNAFSLEGLTALETLVFDERQDFETLSFVEGCTQLRSLTLDDVPLLRDISTLSTLTKLEELTLAVGDNLQDFSSLASLQVLQKLKLLTTQDTIDLSPLAQNATLIDLYLQAPIQNIDFLRGNTTLKKLYLARSPHTLDLSPLASCSALTTIALVELSNVSTLPPLPSLQYVSLETISDIETLELLSQNPDLTVLRVVALPKLQSLVGLTTTLEDLELEQCEALTDLSVLSSFSPLQSLVINRNNSATDMSFVAGLQHLKILILDNFTELESFNGLETLPALNELSVLSLQKLRDISALAKCTSLDELHLSDCTALDSIAVLAQCTSVTKLVLYKLHIDDLSPIFGLSALTSLQIELCPYLRLKDYRTLYETFGDIVIATDLDDIVSPQMLADEVLDDITVLDIIKSYRHMMQQHEPEFEMLEWREYCDDNNDNHDEALVPFDFFKGYEDEEDDDAELFGDMESFLPSTVIDVEENEGDDFEDDED